MVDVTEEDEGIFDIHVEDFVDRFSVSFDGEDFWFVSAALAELAGYISIRKELEFDFFVAVTVALGTATFFAIEGEVSCIEAHVFGFGSACIEFADIVEHTDKCRWTTTRCFSYAGLVDIESVVDSVVATDGFDGNFLFHECLGGFVGHIHILVFFHDGRGNNILS